MQENHSLCIAHSIWLKINNMVTFEDSVKSVIFNYSNLNGRATRGEYWWFQLLWWSASITLVSLAFIFEDGVRNFLLIIWGIFVLLTIVPNYCVCVRRLHDTGWSGFSFLWCLLGIGLGLLIINIRCMMPSDGDNMYGQRPSGVFLNDLNKRNRFHQKNQGTLAPVYTATKTDEHVVDKFGNEAKLADFGLNGILENHKMDAVKYCRYCGKTVDSETGSFCRFCGKKLR